MNLHSYASKVYKELSSSQELVDGMLLKEITSQFMKSFIEVCLENELKEFLDRAKYEPHKSGTKEKRYRNGYSPKIISTELGQISIQVPRDRKSEFNPIIIPKHERNLANITEAVISMYAKGLSQYDISLIIEDLYQRRLSQGSVSAIIQSVTTEVESFRNRELNKYYPVVFLDALYYPVRENGHVSKKALYAMIAITHNGQKECLGYWLRDKEKAIAWGDIFKQLKLRGLEEINIMCCDGLSGLKKVIEKEFPKTLIQRCIIHIVRNCLTYVEHKDGQKIKTYFRRIYQAQTEEIALNELNRTEREWGSIYKNITKPWRDNWQDIRLIFDFPVEVRRIFYTNNNIESYNNELRKITKNKGALPNKQSLYRLCYLRTNELINKRWCRTMRNWRNISLYLYKYFRNNTKNIDMLMNKE